MASQKADIVISAVQLEDVPDIADKSAEGFLDDRQTVMKGLGSKPWDMKSYVLESLPKHLTHPRCVVLKATDAKTGQLMGNCNWGFRGVKPEDIPHVEGRLPSEEPAKQKEEETTDEEAKEEEAKEEEETKETEEKGPIQRLNDMEDADMQRWMDDVMPDGVSCMYIVGLQVNPEFQGRGVGSALLKWGTDLCDKLGIFAWVHSSEGAWKMYQKCGFQVMRELDVDLDAYKPCDPPGEGEGALWGHYVIRYMQYFGKKTE